MCKKKEFEQMPRGDRIEDIHYEESKHGTNKDHLTKLSRRNKEQQEQAKTKAEQLKHNNGWLTKRQRGSVEKGWSLDPIISLQTVDLLEFLGDWAYYYFLGHFKMDGNTIPPFCGDRRHWHSTRQGEWIASPLSLAARRDSREHRELYDFAKRFAKYSRAIVMLLIILLTA